MYYYLTTVGRIVVGISIILLQKYVSFSGNSFPIIASIIAGIILLVYGITSKEIYNIDKDNYKYLILGGILLALWNFASYYLINNSSHPGYFKLLAVYELVLLLIISFIFFKAKIELKHWIGFLFIIIGTIILCI
tara:strand:+ start:1914 stop:2318 length:405 start_codon:yes stop_codon:yes gene_type:complete